MYERSFLSAMSLFFSMLNDELIKRCGELTDRRSLHNLIGDIKKDMLGDKSYPISKKFFKFHEFRHTDYKSFCIPKRSGGYRTIKAPEGNLKWAQLAILKILYAFYTTPSDYAYGFIPGRTIVDNARQHAGKKYVYNIDLKSFFTYVSKKRIAKALQQPPFNFSRDIAHEISYLCSTYVELYNEATDEYDYRLSLPQGAPTSPILTNIACQSLDCRLAGLAKSYNLTYTRYADDITFSSDHNVYQENGSFINELYSIIKNEGFEINVKKERLQHSSVRQEVTGIVVNEKPNISKGWVKDIRAVLHIWQKYGERAALAAYYPRYMEQKGHTLSHRERSINLANIIGGKLCFMKMVKGENDSQYIKLKAIYDNILHNRQTPKDNSIEYLNSESIAEFEKRMGVKIEFGRRKADGHPYGKFVIGKEFFPIGVSCHIDINNIPSDAQISLCRITKNLDTKRKRISLLYVVHHHLHSQQTFNQ